MVLLFVTLLVAFFAHRHDKDSSFEEYALAGRSLPTMVLVMTLLATFIGAGELFIPNFIAQYGLVFASVHIILLIFTFICIGTFLTPYLTYFRDCMTMGDLMCELYGPVAQVITGIVGCIASFVIIIGQIRAIGSVSAYLLGIDSAFSILCFGSLFVLYSVRGGMRAVSYTDILQVIIMLLVFSWVAKTALERVGGLSEIAKYLAVHEADQRPDVLFFVKRLSFWDMSCAFCLTLPIFQRMLMIANKRQARKMWYMSASFYALFIFMMILISLAGLMLLREPITKGLAQGQEVEAVYMDFCLRLIKNLFQHNPLLMDFIFIGILGMLLSTADSFLHALGISILHDILEPLHTLLRGKPFLLKRKSMYARLVVALSGLLALGMGAWQGFILWDMNTQTYVVLLSEVVLVPLLIGILGVKTHRFSFFSFVVVYLTSLVALDWAGWDYYDYFGISLLYGVIAYFIAHLAIYKGFAILTRSKYTTSEQIWVFLGKPPIQKWFDGFFQLPKLARKKLFTSLPPRPLIFSFMVFTLYAIESVIMIGDTYCHIDGFISVIHGIGILLCIGFMLEWSWPARLRPYYALYWFFTLFYCLPFSSTLLFLRAHECMWVVVQWVTMFMFLSFLVDSSLFVILGLSGMLSALVVWWVRGRGFPEDVFGKTGAVGIYGIVLIWIFVLLFQRKKENYTQEKLYWNRITTNNLAHEITNPLQMLHGIGNVLRIAFAEGRRVKDPEGERGFFIQERQYKFLNRFSKRIIEKSKEAQEDLTHFTKFIEQQILGIFEEHSVSIYAYVKEGIRRVSAQYLDKVAVELTYMEDFKAKVLSSVFPNVIASLISNAYHHGHASLVKVKVDGKQRRIYIRDNGKGIPSEIFPHIFDLHYTDCQMNNAGLSFTRMVIEASGGKISCYSKYKEKDSFTEFVIELP